MLLNFSLLAVFVAILLAVLHFLLREKPRLVSWLGKILGLVIGFIVAHAPGAIVGVLIGHLFDSLTQPKRKPITIKPTQAHVAQTASDSSIENIIYFDTLFSIFGNFAQAAGQSYTPYLNKLHNIMQQMQLDEAQQRTAWEFFKYGQHSQFNLTQALFSYSQHCRNDRSLGQHLLYQLLDMANLKLPLTLDQYTILCSVAHVLNLSTAEFAHLAPKVEQAQSDAKSGATGTPLAQSYAMLDLKPTATATEVKWAYRKLMSRYHPDRLMAKDLPEEFIELATRRTQEIKAAYEKINESLNKTK